MYVYYVPSAISVLPINTAWMLFWSLADSMAGLAACNCRVRSEGKSGRVHADAPDWA